MISTKLHGRCWLLSCHCKMPSQASRQAPGEPGRQKMYVPCESPAHARDWIVEVPIFGNEIMWKTVENPSISFSISGFKA